jgi:branched-chain amino acid transport system permease protein
MLLSYALTTGLTSGALYALIAVGLVLVYKATGVINIAHGELFMISGFVAYAAHVQLGLPYFVAFLAAIACGFLLGMLVYRGPLKPLMRSSLANVLVAAVAISFILKGVARAVWGGQGDYLPFPPILSPQPMMLGPVMVIPQQVIAVGVSIALMLSLALFFRATRTGKWMQATADNVKAAKLVGIRIEHIYMLSFGIGAAMAAVASVVMAPITLLYPDIGFILFLKAFAAAVLGGLTSIWGAVLGGVLVGLIEQLAATYLHSKFQEVSSFIVIMFALIFIPNGLLGQRNIRKV